jgi:hypothetical protein
LEVISTLSVAILTIFAFWQSNIVIIIVSISRDISIVKRHSDYFFIIAILRCGWCLLFYFDLLNWKLN